MYIDLSLIDFNLLPTNYQEPFKKGAFDEKEALINSCLLDLCKDYYCTFYWIYRFLYEVYRERTQMHTLRYMVP